MGTSTNGILFYGFPLEDDIGETEHSWLDEDGDGEWEYHYLEHFGVTSPSIVDYDNKTPEEKAAQKIYYERRRELLEAAGCEIDYHCSCDYSMYYVAFKAKNFTAYRGDAVEVTGDMLDIPRVVEGKLRDFCKIMGIKWEQPKWYLVSLWC